jgi:hypothetical protein
VQSSDLAIKPEAVQHRADEAVKQRERRHLESEAITNRPRRIPRLIALAT